MHDDLFERRLRSVLRDEADRLSFSITAAELERRVLHRGRDASRGRLTLLLAAAVAIGALGVGSLAGGLVNTSPSPAPSTAAVASAGPSTGDLAVLPSLDEVIDLATGNSVLLAQAHDWVDTGGTVAPGLLPEEISATLGTIDASVGAQLTVTCSGGGSATLRIVSKLQNDPGADPVVGCDGSVYEQPIVGDGMRLVSISAPRTASWRVVLRSLGSLGPSTTQQPATVDLPPGDEEMVRADDRQIDSGASDAPGLQRQEIGAVAGRQWYRVRASCIGGEAIRHIFGNEGQLGFFPETTTQITCDGLVHETLLSIPDPSGATVSVAADQASRWSVLVSGEIPPVAVADDVPGWNLAGGIGPDFNFDTTGISFSDALENGGPLLVTFECVGPPQTVAVEIDVDAPLGDNPETLIAECSEGGSETSRLVQTSDEGYLASAVSPPGTWTALTARTPEPASSPGATSPITLAGDRPGWLFSAGTGPNLSFDPTPQGFTGPVADGGGQVLVVVVCAGTGSMDVTVDLGRKFGRRQETMVAACSPDGAETGQTFDANASYVTVLYAQPVGSWAAISFLVPDAGTDGS